MRISGNSSSSSILTNRLGIDASIFPFGELNAEDRKDDISVQFQYPFYNTTYDLKPAVIVGSATASVQSGYLKLLSTGTDSVIVESKSSVRYRPGHSGYGQFTASFVGNGTGTAGVYSVGKNGFIVKVSNNVLQIGYEKDGVQTLTSSTNGFFPFGQISVSQIDLTKINIFRVMFGYLGVANPVFQIKLNGIWNNLGMIETEGKLTSTHISNPVLPIGFKASGNMEIRTASWNGGKLGNSDMTGARFFSLDGTKAITSTTKGTFGTFRNKTTYKGIENRVKAKLLRYKFSVYPPASGSGVVQFRIEKNASLTGTPTWNDVDSDNSTLELDLVQTYNSGGKTIYVDEVHYSSSAGSSGSNMSDSVQENAETYGLFLLPGETATITCQNVSGSTNVTTSIIFNWVELF